MRNSYIAGLIVSLCTLSAVNASAYSLPSAGDSWDSIQQAVANNPRLFIDQPNADVAKAFGSTGFFNSCVMDANNLRSLTTMTVCVDGAWVKTGTGPKNDDEQFVCYKSETKYVVVPLQQTAQKCTEWKYGKQTRNYDQDDVCVKWETIQFTLSTTPVFDVIHMINVHDGHQDEDGQPEVLFSKPYVIPACN